MVIAAKRSNAGSRKTAPVNPPKGSFDFSHSDTSVVPRASELYFQRIQPDVSGSSDCSHQSLFGFRLLFPFANYIQNKSNFKWLQNMKKKATT
jgi:hypothetical protein